MGAYMGGLPNKATIVVRDPASRRKHKLTKNDIGAGGNSVNGRTRAIDLYAPAAHYLAHAGCNWTGTVEWQRVR